MNDELSKDQSCFLRFFFVFLPEILHIMYFMFMADINCDQDCIFMLNFDDLIFKQIKLAVDLYMNYSFVK